MGWLDRLKRTKTDEDDGPRGSEPDEGEVEPKA